ncbi:MAG TPA: hypothetical protein VHD85_18810, partial [Terracidiphilus sp.]|nr:hypothetical protein [Terracidiphilus sp.]
MPGFMQIEGARPEEEGSHSEFADLSGATQGWNGLELSIVPEFHLRMVAWSLGLSSILWYIL